MSQSFVILAALVKCFKMAEQFTLFIPRNAMLVWYGICFHRVSVCPPITSRGVLERQLNLGSHKQNHMIAQGIFSFLMPKNLGIIPTGSPKTGAQIEVRSVKKVIFYQCLTTSQKRCKIGIVITER